MRFVVTRALDILRISRLELLVYSRYTTRLYL
jgi:hypothetical protein